MRKNSITQTCQSVLLNHQVCYMNGSHCCIRARTCIYCSTHEVNTALDKDIFFLTERKKILEKIRHVEVGTEQQDIYR